MLALIALYVMRPPFIQTIQDDPFDADSIALRRELDAYKESRTTHDAVQPRGARPVGSTARLDIEASEPDFATG